MKHSNVVSKLLALILVLSISRLASAGGIGIINGATGEYMKLIRSDVQITVNNQIATVKVTEVFKNTSGSDVHFKYGFPLNENANPISLRWYYEDNWYAASMSAAAQDDEIPGAGGGGSSIDPDLEAFLGDSPLFFTTMDTIAANELYTIELTYVELLTYEMGLVLCDLTHDLSGIQPEPIDTQTFSFHLFSDRPIMSADLLGLSTIDFIDAYEATLSLSLIDQPANFDYNLEYELFSDAMGIIPISTVMPDSLYNCDALGNGYLTVIVEPRPYVDTDVMPKNFTLIIDKSGSMGTTKMQEAKDAAVYMLENLNPGDYFNIVSFESYAYSAFSEHVEFNPANKDAGLDFINDISSGGGTNIDGAMSEAIGEFIGVSPDMANIVLFLTDGMGTSTNEETLDLVEAEIAATGVDIYVNTIAVGYGANEELMVLLAEENGGLYIFIEEDAVEEEIISFFNMINNPILLNTTITFTPDIVYEIYPANIPNLYQGQQMILSARYDSAEVVTMHLEGEAFSETVSYDFVINLSDSADENLYVLPKIWAKQKLDQLSVEYFYATDPDLADILQTEIDSLSLCYGVLDVDFGSFDGGDLVGLEENWLNPEQWDLTTYPQPFESIINIRILPSLEPGETLTIEISDLTGKIVRSEIVMVNGDAVVIDDLDWLTFGTYILKVSTDKNTYTTKLAKL